LTDATDDYLELYVAKELNEMKKQVYDEIENKITHVSGLKSELDSISNEISRVDVHFTKIIKSILFTQGIAVKNLEATEIFK
jgi:hypothetical protein